MSSATQPEQQDGNQTYVGAAVTGMSSGASYTYDSVASTASYTYTQATNLVASLTGNPATSDESSKTVDNPAKDEQPSSTTESALPQHPHQEEKERGPSNSDRVGKSQQEIGTEYNIPTAAGLGSTRSCDDDMKPAADKEASQNKAKAAAVGQDYASQPCPDSDESAHKKPADSVDNTAHTEPDDDTTGTTSHGGLGNKVKNKVKGEAKVISGKIHKDEDKVQLGKSIKAGTA